MKTIGIMTHQHSPRPSWLRQNLYAKAAGYQRVVFYTPHLVQLSTQRVTGYVRRNKKWIVISTFIPHINHDIGYYLSAATTRKVKYVKQLKNIIFTGHGLGDKWTIHSLLEQCPAANPFIIPTQLLESLPEATTFISEQISVILKPTNGCQGRDIYRINLTDTGFIVETPNRRHIDMNLDKLLRFLQRKKRKEKWVLQKYINIIGPHGAPCDIRVLMQKNGNGDWKISGEAIREGSGSGLTCNIKTGGHIFEVLPFLSEQFEPSIAEQLKEDADELCLELSKELETYSQKRYVELGYDLAIDQEGRLWIMEINIKPGKAIMRTLYGKAGRYRSGVAPYRYARYLQRQMKRSKNNKLKVSKQS